MSVVETLLAATSTTSPQTLDLPGCGQAVIASIGRDDPGANEDALAVWSLGEGEAVLAVADGVGGMRLGAQAARTALETLGVCLRGKAEGQIEGASLRSRILTGFELANQRVLALRAGAATTLVAVQIRDGVARCYHAGDSSATVVGQRGRVKFRTVAHSPVGFGEAAGFIDSDEAMFHEERHIVSNLLGDAEMHIDVGPTVPLARYDTVVLGSDGLWDNLHFEEVVDLLCAGRLTNAVADTTDLVRERMRRSDDHEQTHDERPDDLPGKLDDLTVVAFRLKE